MSFARHPPLLRVLIITELGERFGGYLLLALLTIYLTEQLGWTAAKALRVNGVFLALCYGLSLPCGLWADRAPARSTAIVTGCALMTGGYLFLAFGSTWACLAGLSFLAIGNGLFKPTMPALIGELYTASDPRREEAFTLFYAGANLGAIFAPPIGEWLRRNYGWAAAFSVSALVQLGTTAYFRHAWGATRASAGQKQPNYSADRVHKMRRLPLRLDERRRLHWFLFMTVLSLWFWVALQQTGGSLTLFARDHTDRLITVPLSGHWKQLEIPVGWLASIHAGLVIMLSPIITLLLGWRQRLGRAISGPVQMAIGTALLAVAYGALILPLSSREASRVGFSWLFLCYTALSLAEIFVGPLGYSLVSSCAPAGYSGLLMGMWLAVTSVGSFLAGEVGARLWTRWSPLQFFAFLALGCVVICALLVGAQSNRRLDPLQPRS